ncbi:unnamed protein product [Cladocopium goreaui]|uniref:F-box protein n=1 Tax=Cladocopium goreaui TaxID=2562237 RepID=A0A9P1DUA0_9DINO|nr:unnamed protein product [Cladocopium goreaui]
MDRVCAFVPCASGNGKLRQIKYWAVDKFHALKHKKTCKHNILQVRRLANRFKKTKTSACEQVFSWFRNYARLLNEARPWCHAFSSLFCKAAQRSPPEPIPAHCQAEAAQLRLQQDSGRESLEEIHEEASRLCSHGWMWLARGQKQWHLVTLEEAVAGCEAVPQGAPEDLFSVKGCKEFDAWLKRLNVRHQAWCGNLCEGELVFIPSGILHGVKNVGKGISIAVSHNFLDETCMTSVLGCLRQALQMLLDEMSRRSLSGALASLEQQLGPQARLLATSAEVLLPRLEKRGVDVADLIALSRSSVLWVDRRGHLRLPDGAGWSEVPQATV